MLEAMKVRASRFVQSYDFAIDHSVVRKITERLCDLGESFVEPKSSSVPAVRTF
jgi:hypothetical protein